MQDKNVKGGGEIDNDVDFQEDVSFEDLNTDGEEMTNNQKIKSEKEKLREKFEDKIIRLEKERDEYLSGWQRVQADYKNREKEIEEYKKTFSTFANERLIKDLLPVLDGYDMARANVELWEKVDSGWRTGVEFIFSQLLNVLNSNGLKTFGEINENYDPGLHEAVEVINLSQEEKDKNDKIMFVLQKGYKIGEKILRPARVKVGKIEN